jgi:hypothetical protein
MTAERARYDAPMSTWPENPDPRAPLGPMWYGQQDENGVDLSIIRENFKYTVEQRLRRAEAGRQNALWLRRHVRVDQPKSS